MTKSTLFFALFAIACGLASAGVYNNEHTWVAGNLTLAFPKNPVLGGFDPYGYYTYVGRVIYNNAVLPARVVPELGLAYFNTDLVSSKASSYQILTQKANVLYTWVRSYDGYREEDSVSVGTAANDERVYICRSKSDGGLLFGTLYLSQKLCIIKSDDLPLRKFDKYEVLVAKAIESPVNNSTITH
ncbi:uncharacterized protein LOC115622949 [Scaptodrosophila lebanonensis]|uniref:Uncharacterized protein LOC115622949 n=1 Tax=Drosophila lebanonensis TaxID=7225 RepID=A0A6J2TA83_DROLE|nr:uncharacterized protein LOC115622949 [Scaptodrosophila lebanonensis]